VAATFPQTQLHLRGTGSIAKGRLHVSSGTVKNTIQCHEDALVIPSCATLDGFDGVVPMNDGVTLTDIEPLTALFVRTMNSAYRIIVSENSNVLIQGGNFFPRMAEARLNGSGFGGNVLKLAWIGVGLCMEIYQGSQRIITSPVRAIHVEPRLSGFDRSVH
jgi:hypothetical protein